MFARGSLEGGTLGGSSGDGESSMIAPVSDTLGFGISRGGGGDCFSVLLLVTRLLLLDELLVGVGDVPSFFVFCLAMRAWLGLGFLGGN